MLQLKCLYWIKAAVIFLQSVSFEVSAYHLH